ncbi:MAG: beta-lactamase family protein [Acidimicrobiales bacterium]|nr:beta-lactamase family protein [Acidimicrobiales bacterium]
MSLDTALVDPAEVGMSPARLEDAAALMQRQYDTGRSPTLVAVVARHGRVVFTHAVGEHRPGGPAVTTDSIFPLASQTKPMTAAVLLCLVERGLVGLNEPITVHLPELEGQGHDEVMVNSLLTHTSGWHEDDFLARVDERLDDVIAGWSPGGRSLLDEILLTPCFETPRREVPGVIMQYCNLNYTLLGEIIRRVTGDSLDAAMRRHLFEPLAMTSSAVIVPDDWADRVIGRPPGIPFGPEHPDSPIAFDDPLWAKSDDGASGVHATAVDALRFAQMILDRGLAGGRRVLSGDAVRVMTTDQVPGIAAEVLGMHRPEARWGYGYAVTGTAPWLRFGGATVAVGSLRHGGAGGIDVWIDPSTGVVGVYFEVVTEWSDEVGPVSWAAHRFEDVVTAAVVG